MFKNENSFVDWIQHQQQKQLKALPRTTAQKDLYIGDDTAYIARGNYLFTTDMLIDGVHFDLTQQSAERIAHKCLAVNLSDIAAMGGTPESFVVSLAIPRGMDQEFLRKFYEALLKFSAEYQVQLAGGDTNTSHYGAPFVVNIAMTGIPHFQRGIITRFGAKNKDIVVVTGCLGGSLTGKHLDFTPRLAEAKQILDLVSINAMMDISDGLAVDLERMGKASNCFFDLKSNKIPINTSVSQENDNISRALCDGEDFELVFTLDQNSYQTLLTKYHGPLFAIGTVETSTRYPAGSVVLDDHLFLRQGYVHSL